MINDAWNPKTFSNQISSVLTENSKLIFDYYIENQRLMDEHLNSSPYQSLKSNRLTSTYQDFHENILTPIIARSRIRVWHYTRLTDEEANEMHQQLIPSSLEHLRHRLNNLVKKELLTKNDADTIFTKSPLHKQPCRAGGLYATTIPVSHYDSGVEPLLESWGGESAYFWLSDKSIAKTLKNLGISRILEIETPLTDKLNGYRVAKTFLDAWALQLGAPATISGCDLFISGCIDTAKVTHIHTRGDRSFETIGKIYPEGIESLLKADNKSIT